MSESVLRQIECFEMVVYKTGGVYIQLHDKMDRFAEVENEKRREKLRSILLKYGDR